MFILFFQVSDNYKSTFGFNLKFLRLQTIVFVTKYFWAWGSGIRTLHSIAILSHIFSSRERTVYLLASDWNSGAINSSFSHDDNVQPLAWVSGLAQLLAKLVGPVDLWRPLGDEDEIGLRNDTGDLREITMLSPTCENRGYKLFIFTFLCNA